LCGAGTLAAGFGGAIRISGLNHANKRRDKKHAGLSKSDKKDAKREKKDNDMSNLIIEKLLAKTRRTDLPEFRPGDTVRVHVKIKEGDKERLQAFEGVVIKRDNGPQASFTVRKISFGQGVERIFPIHSKVIDKVDLLRSSKVRRAKLYYLRGLKGKAARLRDVERPE
jgi:large subunit ribosomal protein L19